MVCRVCAIYVCRVVPSSIFCFGGGANWGALCMGICLWCLAYAMLISYLGLFIFILVFSLCSVRRGSFRLGRLLRCTGLIDFFLSGLYGAGLFRG